MIPDFRQWENDFLSKAFCEDVKQVSSRIHERYIEVTKQGALRHSVMLISYLTQLEQDIPLKIAHFAQENISDDLVLVHYEGCQTTTGMLSRCTSLWKKESEAWQLFFHQSTRISEK